MFSNRKLLTGGALAALAVLFVAAILISNTVLRGARIDLTESRLYTLSDGTKKILASIDDPVNLYFYYSDRGSRDIPQLRTYAQRVRDMLDELVARSNGKLKLEVIDPQPFSEDEDRAVAYGLQPVPSGPSGENIFLGLVGTNSTSGKVAMPFLQSDKEAFLEYDLAKLIYQLSAPKKRVVGIISGLPMGPAFDPAARQMREGWAVEQQLKQLFEVRELDPAKLKNIDPAISVLVLVHPKTPSEEAQYAIDQFVMRGGRLLVFVDPHADSDQGVAGGDPRAALLADKSSDLPRLFKGWGIEYDPQTALLDRGHALVVAGADGRPVRAASMLGFAKRDMNAEDITTAYLERINVSSPGGFKLAKDSRYKLVPLIQTGTEAMMVPTEKVKFATDPGELMVGYQPGNERYAIAGRIEGKFASAFPDRKGEGHLAEAQGDGLIVVVADTDVLTNRLWLQAQSFRQSAPNVFANNGDFFLNAVDYLAGSSELMSIRGRAVSQRPFSRIEDMKRDAEASFRGKERELQQQLAATDRKLTELQSTKTKQNDPILSPEQQRELQSFMQKKVEIRKELRQVRRGLDEQIESLGTRLKFINIGLMPLLLTLAALAFAWWRRQQRAAYRSAQ